MIVAALLLLAGAAGGEQVVDWRSVATPADRERLRHWRDDWQRSLAAARAGGDGAALAADPALFSPDAALDEPALPVGPYRCRVVKFAGAHLAEGAWGRCVIAAAGEGRRRLERGEGNQRFSGAIYPDASHRSIFLGAMAYPGERHPLPYGRAAGRDMIGLVERIGAQRWRVVLPSPRYESQLDLLELAPAP